MAFLELKGVEKYFGSVQAIKGIDLAIEPGDHPYLQGAWTPLLEEVNFWRRLERGVQRLTGRAPKPPYAQRAPASRRGGGALRQIAASSVPN